MRLPLQGAVAPPLAVRTLSDGEVRVALRLTAVALDLAYTLPFERVSLRRFCRPPGSPQLF